MGNVVGSVVSGAKSALGGVGNKVSGSKSFMSSMLKWAATGLAVVLASAVLVPLLRRLPYVNRLQSGSAVVAGVVLMVAAGFIAMLKMDFAHFLAAGLGIAGAISALSVLLQPAFARVNDVIAEVM